MNTLLAIVVVILAVAAIRALQKQGETMAKIDEDIQGLQSEVANQTTVVTSAVALIGGFNARLDAAIQNALAQGATAAQLTALTDLQTTLAANDKALADAVVAGTPAA